MTAEEQAILDFFVVPGNGDMLCDVCHGYISTCARDAIEHLRDHRAAEKAVLAGIPTLSEAEAAAYHYVPKLDHEPAPHFKAWLDHVEREATRKLGVPRTIWGFSELETRARAIEAIENPPSPLITCPPCQGTGGTMEGPHLGALCRVCKGSGSIPRERLAQFSHAAQASARRPLAPSNETLIQKADASQNRWVPTRADQDEVERAAERIMARAAQAEEAIDLVLARTLPGGLSIP